MQYNGTQFYSQLILNKHLHVYKKKFQVNLQDFSDFFAVNL